MFMSHHLFIHPFTFNFPRKQRCCECITMLTVLSVFTAFSMYVVFAYGFYIGQREPFSLLHKEWPYKVKKAEVILYISLRRYS